jgi:hypothetical protein
VGRASLTNIAVCLVRQQTTAWADLQSPPLNGPLYNRRIPAKNSGFIRSKDTHDGFFYHGGGEIDNNFR